MIQRKQSLFLFLAVVLLLTATFCTRTVFVNSDRQPVAVLSNLGLSVYKTAVKTPQSDTATVQSDTPATQNATATVASHDTDFLYAVTGIMLVAAAIMAGMAIWTYRNRRKQMKLCNFTVFVILVYYVTRVCCAVAISDKFDLSFGINVTDAFPLVALILTIMAHSAIKKDDDLVRAADRIR